MTRLRTEERRARVRHLIVMAALVAAMFVPALAPAVRAAPARPEVATSVQPDRVLDTRIGLGATGPVGPGRVVALAIPAAHSAGAATVVLNVTAVDASGPGWAKVWPCGAAEPATSSLNFVPGQISANAVVVRLGNGNGNVCISTYSPVQLVADLSGWFTGTTDFTGTTPNRVLDTRGGQPLVAGVERRLHVGGTAGVAGNATIAALNLTVVDPPAAGWVVAYPCGIPTTSSTINFGAGEIVANLTFVGLTDGDVCLRSFATTDLVVDTSGWSSGTGQLRVQSPQRLLDTRTWPYGQLGTSGRIQLRVAGQGGTPDDAAAALLTVTVTDVGGSGFVTAWPCDQPLPTASTINTGRGLLRSNLALVELAADGTACLQLYTSDNTSLDLVVDAVGWETGGPTRGAPPAAPTPPTYPTPAPSATHFTTLPVGSALPNDAQCAAAVRRTAEVRPANATFNATRGSTPQTGYFARVTGDFTGTTDEVIQWASCKWGIDEDIVRAQTAKESYWFQRSAGDFSTDPTHCASGHVIGQDGVAGQCPESVGLMQVRFPYWTAAFPSATTSSAYNVDEALAARRACFDGREAWLNTVSGNGSGYAAGDIWGCVGLWFSGRWHDPAAETYILAVKDLLIQRIWTTPSFIGAS